MNMANFFLELLCSTYYSIDMHVLLEAGLWVHYGEYLFIPRGKFKDDNGETNRHRWGITQIRGSHNSAEFMGLRARHMGPWAPLENANRPQLNA